MESIAATEASNRFGHLLDRARSEPIQIEKQGRPVAVVIAVEEYRRMEAELERSENARLQESIADMKAGRVVPAQSAFAKLKERYPE